MSRISEFHYDVQELYIDGHSARVIAMILECPVALVLDAIESFGVADQQQDDIELVDYQG
jgi:hypothetical protein